MKDWLERQAEIEKDVLDAVGQQVRGVVDDLLPQIRLAALENHMEAVADIKIYFTFEDNGTGIHSEASVQFPPKHSASASVVLE